MASEGVPSSKEADKFESVGEDLVQGMTKQGCRIMRPRHYVGLCYGVGLTCMSVKFFNNFCTNTPLKFCMLIKTGSEQLDFSMSLSLVAE